MKLKLRPILAEMKAFYSEPASPMRFKKYLEMLQGDSKRDLLLPIGGYNPMAKDHIKAKIEELESINAEEVMREATIKFNDNTYRGQTQEVTIVLNIADDLKGGWTNRHTTDFDSKFKISALATRGFCAPYFWSSETYTADLIKDRTMEYAYRTQFWIENNRLRTLEEHLNQEIYVCKMMANKEGESTSESVRSFSEYFKEHKLSREYSVIFNLFYGDKVCKSLGYPHYGITKFNGFDYANYLSKL